MTSPQPEMKMFIQARLASKEFDDRGVEVLGLSIDTEHVHKAWFFRFGGHVVHYTLSRLSPELRVASRRHGKTRRKTRAESGPSRTRCWQMLRRRPAYC